MLNVLIIAGPTDPHLTLYVQSTFYLNRTISLTLQTAGTQTQSSVPTQYPNFLLPTHTDQAILQLKWGAAHHHGCPMTHSHYIVALSLIKVMI